MSQNPPAKAAAFSSGTDLDHMETNCIYLIQFLYHPISVSGGPDLEQQQQNPHQLKNNIAQMATKIKIAFTALHRAENASEK